MADSDRQGSRQPPWHQEQDLEQVSFGTWLRRQREARGIELREIADHTKIGIRYLEALERDRFELLPAPVFTKGFLSQYGLYVGLDPDQVVNTYLNARQESDEEGGNEPVRRRRRGMPRTLLVLLLVVLLGLLALAWNLVFRARRDAVPEEVRLPIAAPAPPAPQPIPEEIETLSESAVVAPLVVTLDFVDDCWLETQVDGERQLSEQIGKGESRRILAQEEVVLTLGNAPGVRVEVNGMLFQLPPEGADGVLRNVRIDLATASRLADEDAP